MNHDQILKAQIKICEWLRLLQSQQEIIEAPGNNH